MSCWAILIFILSIDIILQKKKEKKKKKEKRKEKHRASMSTLDSQSTGDTEDTADNMSNASVPKLMLKLNSPRPNTPDAGKKM